MKFGLQITCWTGVHHTLSHHHGNKYVNPFYVFGVTKGTVLLLLLFQLESCPFNWPTGICTKKCIVCSSLNCAVNYSTSFYLDSHAFIWTLPLHRGSYLFI
jgi:hypothetical protein